MAAGTEQAGWAGDSDLWVQTVPANGLRFEVLMAGDPGASSLALLLHGFPEHAISWREQMLPLARLGYRVWAPNQRGYGGSSRPPRVQDYDLDALMADVAALIDRSGAKRVVLIGHDWGGVVAWCFAARRLRPVDRLVILNVPHPACYLRSLRHPGQWLRSWYIGAFQIPRLPEWLGSRDHGRPILEAVLRSARHPDRFPPEMLGILADQASDPDRLRAMIDWYRAAFRGGLARQIRRGLPLITTPTLLIWGEEDTALASYTTHGTEKYAPNLTVRYLPGISHFVQQEAAEEVNALLAGFLPRG
jgi:pimeloyl-ACP methyl ester carboxylesterase